MTLNEFEQRLDPTRFRRLHRSAIVNLDHVVSGEPIDRRLRLKLSDGAEVVASRGGSRNPGIFSYSKQPHSAYPVRRTTILSTVGHVKYVTLLSDKWHIPFLLEWRTLLRAVTNLNRGTVGSRRTGMCEDTK